MSLLSQLLEHQFRDAHFEADLTSFIVLKNKHERATGTSLGDDLLVTLMMNKTRGQLQQHLRLQANSLRTFDQVLVIIKEHYQSRHLVSSKLQDSQGPAPMDIGAAWKGKGKGKKGKGFMQGKGKGMMMKGKGKGLMKGKGKGLMKGKGKGFGFNKGKGKGKGLKGKGKGKNDGCFICGSRDHWANNCPRAYTQGALWQIDEGSEWSEDWNTDWNQEQQIAENGESTDWSEYQGALYDDSAWTEDSSWQPPNWITEVQQAALPPPLQPIVSQASSAAKTAPIAQHAQPQTAAAVIASPPGLADPSHIADESLIASSSSRNSRGSGIARTARPGIASKLFVGALMLIGTLSSSVPVIPEHTPLSAPTFSAAPLSSSTSFSQDERIDIPEHIDELPDQDRLASFHNRSGIVGSTWILFDSGASANCCPPWFAEDYPLLPVGSNCPILRSISGKTLDIIGNRVVELDCGGHSLCIHFYVCQSIPFPLVSVARFLLQDFWTIMSRSFMALMTPTCKAVPIVRQGTLVYLTPTIVPYKDSDVRYTEAHISSIVSDLDLEDCDVELRGITDVTDNDYDHIAQIHSLIAAAKDKSKSTPKALDKTRKRSDYKNCDYWVVNEDKCVLVRHHVKQRQNLMGFRYLRGELPVDANRLTGHRETERFFADGTSDVIVDQDFRALDDDRVDPHTKSEIAPWRGRTAFKLKPLTGQALVKAKKAAEKFQAAPATTLQKDRFRLSQAKSFAKAKAKAIPKPALSDVPSSSHEAPPAQPIVSNPGVSSRGTEMQIEPPQKIDRKHMVTTKEGEKVIMNQLRSIREFNRSMKDLIVRLFYTVDSQTCQARTTDHWVQTPTHWIRMVHQERDDLIHPDKCPSPLSSADALAFGDTLIANRHTCVLESSDPECNGLEIDDHWCNYTDGTGVEKAPEIDPERKLGYRWCGFSVFQIASPIETERLVPETVDVAARAPRGLRVPIEPTASERRQHELTHLPYRDWCQFCVKAKGGHAASKKQLDRQPVIQVDYCFHSTDPKLPLRKLLTAVDIVTGLGMTIVIPSKGNDDYAAAELKKFIYECGRTFGILQYDQESSLKALCTRVCAELGGLSIRAVPKAILRRKDL